MYGGRNLKGKHGVILLLALDGDEELEDEKVRGLQKKCDILRENQVNVPVTLFASKSDLLSKAYEPKSTIINISTNDTLNLQP